MKDILKFLLLLLFFLLGSTILLHTPLESSLNDKLGNSEPLNTNNTSEPSNRLGEAKYGREHIYKSLETDVDRILKENVSTMTDLRTTEPVAVNTNSHGLRDRSLSKEKPVNTTRILVIGSSYTFGTGVNTSERYTEILERKLNTNLDSRYQVINAGVPGWGIENFYMFFEERGLEFEPDVVVTTFMFNDRFSNQKRQGIADEANERVDRKHPNITDPVERHKKVIEYMDKRNKQEFNQVKANESGLRFLQNISNLADENGVEDVYYKLGWLDKDAETYVNQWVSENNETLLRPPQKFYNYCGTKSESCTRQENPYKLSPPWNGDPSEKGHKLLAETLYNNLEESLT